jgi:hypothetical protein
MLPITANGSSVMNSVPIMNPFWVPSSRKEQTAQASLTRGASSAAVATAQAASRFFKRHVK